MNGKFVLNFAPLLLNIPYQQSKLIAAINQIEKESKIFFRVSFQIENEGSGTLELEVEIKKITKMVNRLSGTFGIKNWVKYTNPLSLLSGNILKYFLKG